MLATVRVARGMTQSQLAARTGVSQATLSKAESGLVQLDEQRLAALAQVLDVPAGLLVQHADFAGPQAVVFHRKRASLPVSAAARLRAALDLVQVQVGAVMADAVPLGLDRVPLPEDGYLTPEEVAADVRAALGIPRGPVPDVVGALERAGVAVVARDLGSVKIDALMSWPPGGRPVVLLGSHAPGDRQRFSVAHELGHAVMHEIPTEHQEQEADRFAAELLMPRADIVPELRQVSVPALARLKRRWGTSMAALLRRARDLDQISDAAYRRLNIELSQAGYRTREPVEVPQEQPQLVQRRVRERLDAGERVADLAEQAWMTPDDFRRTYLSEELS